MPHKNVRHKLLLDENFPTRDSLKRLNGRFNVKHLITDFGKAGIKDKEVLFLAIKYKRIIVTFNERDFKNLIMGNKDTGLIGVSAKLTNEQIDNKLTSFLLKHSPRDLYGKINCISGETGKKLLLI